MPEAVPPSTAKTTGARKPRRKPRNSARLAQRQSALLRLSSAIAEAQEEREICERVVNGLHDPALGYDLLALYMLEESTADRALRASVGWQDLPAKAESQSAGSELEVPLKVGDKVLGVLMVESPEADAFDREDFEIINAAVNQATLAIAFTVRLPSSVE